MEKGGACKYSISVGQLGLLYFKKEKLDNDNSYLLAFSLNSYHRVKTFMVAFYKLLTKS